MDLTIFARVQHAMSSSTDYAAVGTAGGLSPAALPDDDEYPPRFRGDAFGPNSIVSGSTAGTSRRYGGEQTQTFLTEGDPDYDRCLATSYAGFVVERGVGSTGNANSTGGNGSETHSSTAKRAGRERQRLRAIFAGLDRERAFQHDVIQPLGLGTPCTETKVARTLIGDPGITYKYLNLRIFAHPWESLPSHQTTHKAIDVVTEEDCLVETGEADRKMPELCVQLKQLNDRLTKRSRRHLRRLDMGGSAAYNLVLINRARPLAEIEGDLKDDPLFDMGKVRRHEEGR